MADLPYDLVGGLTLCAIAIPEQIATARLGAFAPQIGLFAFIAGSLAFAAFGASRYLSAGADSTITPIFAGGLGLLAVSTAPEYAALAGVLALLVGIILIVAGFFRLGWVADLLSVPVTTGFLAGIAIHILLSQAPALLGVAETQGLVYDRVQDWLEMARYYCEVLPVVKSWSGNMTLPFGCGSIILTWA